jgi:hypothetical protein
MIRRTGQLPALWQTPFIAGGGIEIMASRFEFLGGATGAASRKTTGRRSRGAAAVNFSDPWLRKTAVFELPLAM